MIKLRGGKKLKFNLNPHTKKKSIWINTLNRNYNIIKLEVNTAASVSAAVWESFFVKTVKHVNTKEDRYYYQSRNRCVASALCLLFLTWRRLSWNICSALELKSLPSVGTCLYHSIFNLRSFIIPLVNASKPLSLFYSFRISILLRLDLPGQPSKFHCPLIMSSNFFLGGGVSRILLTASKHLILAMWCVCCCFFKCNGTF